MNRASQIFRCEDVIAILREQMMLSKFGIKSLFLFGSVARNEANQESDLDFIVDFEGSVTFDRYMDLKIFLEDLFDRQIDLAIESSLKPQIRQRVVEEAILVARGDASNVT
ncbi:MAG: nucleotidyltransferase family protein [Chamaesiphon sp.]|nr:nucleotidyltransferase family protein [Chamaesiphon sp.]